MAHNALSSSNLYDLIKNMHEYLNSLEYSSESFFSVCSYFKSLYIQIQNCDISGLDVSKVINSFSACDHLFYIKVLSKVTTEEEQACLLSSISNIGQLFSQLFQESIGSKYHSVIESGEIQNCLFIIKGGYNLAHMSFIKSVLLGSKLHNKQNSSTINFNLVFLDGCKVPPNDTPSIDLGALDTYNKMKSLKEIVRINKIGTIIWPSVSQNVSLFLGSRFAKQQIFWSARYRNFMFETVDKYFFGARHKKQHIVYNGCTWRYGRFFAAEWDNNNIITSKSKLVSASDQQWSIFLDRKKNQGWILCATLSNERKMSDQNFIKSIVTLLNTNSSIYYFFASRNKDSELEKVLIENKLQSRFKRINWINTMTPILKQFDIIFDSFPVGSSHTLCYSLRAGTPFLSLMTAQNLESSLLETIFPILKTKSISPTTLGIASNINEYLKLASHLVHSDVARNQLLKNQVQLLSDFLVDPIPMYQDFSEHILQ